MSILMSGGISGLHLPCGSRRVAKARSGSEMRSVSACRRQEARSGSATKALGVSSEAQRLYRVFYQKRPLPSHMSLMNEIRSQMKERA